MTIVGAQKGISGMICRAVLQRDFVSPHTVRMAKGKRAIASHLNVFPDHEFRYGAQYGLILSGFDSTSTPSDLVRTRDGFPLHFAISLPAKCSGIADSFTNKIQTGYAL